MPKSIFAAVFVLLAGVLLSGCNTTQRTFNGCDYGDGVCNQGSRD